MCDKFVYQLIDWHLSVEFAFFDLVVIFLPRILINFVGKNFSPFVVSVKTYLLLYIKSNLIVMKNNLAVRNNK